MRATTPQQARSRPGDALIRRALDILDSRLREPGGAMRTPFDVRNYLKLHLAEADREIFGVMFLDAQHRLIELRWLFAGTLTQTSVYPREVVKASLAVNACSVILVHCHPSGVSEPSLNDELLTKNLRKALDLVDITIVDHLIVAGKAVPLSFAERGLL